MPPLPRIDPDRLWRRQSEMDAIGATPGGGVHRLALGADDIEAHRRLADWAAARGWTVALDDIGNMFLRRAGSDPALPPVASGSHTDSQPMAGRFDGMSGVLAAFEALETIDDAGIATRHPLEVAIWNNEEGPRFAPACMGSAVYAGMRTLAEMRATADADGITMGACVDDLKAALPDAGRRELGAPFAAFIESHIEQGVTLEGNGNIIGVVTGMQGYRRFRVEVTGADAHSGTTPRARRKDAFVAATEMAVALRAAFIDDTDTMRFTIGRFEVEPGGISVVPGRVVFVIDLRHPSAAALQVEGDRVAAICAGLKGPCEVTITPHSASDPMEFPEAMRARLAAAATARGYPNQPIFSGAGHDARHIARLGPAGMIFIPCKDGISHNEAESAEKEHCAAAAQVIADVLIELAGPV
ncbi:MAG: hydantoinase/carbamoylase family amidase [Proteobacteria bacterium]|nr:hydantoinase/carbamoylase family amidase [Pseudomonadota bacterium]